MRPSNFVPASACIVLGCLAEYASAYFRVNQPTSGTQWTNGETHLVSWVKGLGDGIDGFDLELARLGDDGLIYVARDISCTKHSTPALNLALVDIPPADDYFLIFLNSTPGRIFATSDRFTILDSSSTPTATPSTETPNPSAATVTISGSPNPTKAFVTTFAANGSLKPLPIGELHLTLAGLGTVMFGAVVGGFLVW